LLSDTEIARALDSLGVSRPHLPVRNAKIRLPVLDDWAMAKPTAEQRRDLMEVIGRRHD
jgi:hypothetical protein